MFLRFSIEHLPAGGELAPSEESWKDVEAALPGISIFRCSSMICWHCLRMRRCQ